MKSSSGVRHLVMACAAICLVSIMAPRVAVATECGERISSDLVLENDLTCVTYDEGGNLIVRNGLILDADNVTINLNGHTISGILPEPGVTPPNAWSAVKTRVNRTYNDVRVINGTIVGFDFGVAVRNTTGAVVEDLTIRDPRAAGVSVEGSTEVRLNRLYVTGPPPFTTNAAGVLVRGGAGVRVRNVFVLGFLTGVAFEGSEGGDVKDSAITGSETGIAIGSCSNTRVAGNFIWSTGGPDASGGGIGGGFLGPNEGLRIVDNVVVLSARGVFNQSLTGSRITGNMLLRNTNGGIELHPWSYGNVIAGNYSLGNGTDLWVADEFQWNDWPNVWAENICQIATPWNGTSCSVGP